MPYLIFNDGTRLFVNYDKASRINEVLEGIKEPSDQTQAEFCEKIASVEFEEIKKKYVARNPIEKDPKLKQLMNDSKLKGKEKFEAIGNYIKSKQVTI